MGDLLGNVGGPNAGKAGNGERADTLAGLLHLFPVALFITDRDLRITSLYGKPPTAGTLGLEPQALIGKTLTEILGSFDRGEGDPVLVHFEAALRGQSATFRYDLQGTEYEVAVEPLVGTVTDGRQEILGCLAAAVDVTRQGKLERAAARADALLSRAERMTHLGLWEWRSGEDTVEWSDELLRIYGLTRDAFEGTFEGFLARVHTDDRAYTRHVIFEAMRTGAPFRYEHRIVRPNGQVRMLVTQGEVVPASGGDPTRMVGQCWDITEKWESMLKLEQTVSLLRAALESTADGLLVVDLEGKVRISNHRFAELWGMNPSLLAPGDDASLLRHAAEQLVDPEEFLHTVDDLYAQRELSSFDVLEFKDGRVFERYSQPQRIGDSIVGRVWSFRDVSETRSLIQRTMLLSDASRLLASLDAREALEGVARLTVPKFADVCAVDLLNGGTWERLTLVLAEGVTPRASDLHASVFAGHPSRFVLDDVAAMAIPLKAHGRVVGVLSFERHAPRAFDAHELEVGEELAQRAALALENAGLYLQAQEALGRREEFLSVAAHEFRGPLTSIHLAIQTLRRPTMTTEAKRKASEIIEREDRRLSRLVDELLDVTRIRRGQMTFELEEVDLTSVVREVAARLGPELTRSGSKLSIRAAEPVTGWWDRGRVDQIVTNLLSNAVKYGAGQPLDLVVESDEERARLTVRDRGIGISEEARARIFDPFERAVSARSYGGLGLGLYIVRTVVAGMGGTVSVESRPNEGSTFVVTLPLGRRP